jgi:hypothetical protein
MTWIFGKANIPVIIVLTAPSLFTLNTNRQRENQKADNFCVTQALLPLLTHYIECAALTLYGC